MPERPRHSYLHKGLSRIVLLGGRYASTGERSSHYVQRCSKGQSRKLKSCLGRLYLTNEQSKHVKTQPCLICVCYPTRTLQAKLRNPNRFYQSEPCSPKLEDPTSQHLYPRIQRKQLHIYINACIHTYKNECMHTSIHTYRMNACMHTYIHACLHTYIPTYIPMYLDTYTHIYTHTHIYICIHIYVYTHVHPTHTYKPQTPNPKAWSLWSGSTVSRPLTKSWPSSLMAAEVRELGGT